MGFLENDQIIKAARIGGCHYRQVMDKGNSLIGSWG